MNPKSFWATCRVGDIHREELKQNAKDCHPRMSYQLYNFLDNIHVLKKSLEGKKTQNPREDSKSHGKNSTILLSKRFEKINQMGGYYISTITNPKPKQQAKACV